MLEKAITAVLFLISFLFFLIVTYLCVFATCGTNFRDHTPRLLRRNCASGAESGGAGVDVLIRYSPSKSLARAFNIVEQQS